MWESRKMGGAPGFFLWNFLWTKTALSTGGPLDFLSTIAFSTFHRKIVDKECHSMLLLFTLELMSRMIDAIEGSFRIMSSTLRIELRTVA